MFSCSSELNQVLHGCDPTLVSRRHFRLRPAGDIH